MRKTILFLVSALFFTGCATQGGWQPTVDPYNDPNAAHIGRDMEDCRQYVISVLGRYIIGGSTCRFHSGPIMKR